MKYSYNCSQEPMDIVKQMSDEVTDNESLSRVHSGIGLLKNIEKDTTE